ncbi:HNH endonuclease signature motif containing protein [Vibrio natriegens]|uniref:HNH endonuclease signature motif containing protein n=1 Tax=Vibrio natriegens TaxID=691 RepID=UPI00355933FF
MFNYNSSCDNKKVKLDNRYNVMHASIRNRRVSLVDNRETITTQLIKQNREEFSSVQKNRILNKSKVSNGGFYTCSNCGFQHKLLRYAKYRGANTGDGSFHVDHIIPASKGGRALIRNGAVLCGTCNTSKGNRATAKATGIKKYAGLHRKSKLKDYRVKRKGR